jgi:hypothetical protein
MFGKNGSAQFARFVTKNVLWAIAFSIIVDEDVSSGATAFMLDKILVEQKAYNFLDSAPETLSAKDHRPAYGSDGDYFSKPSIDDIVEKAYGILTEENPIKFPKLF